jgi:hypothetical protein
MEVPSMGLKRWGSSPPPSNSDYIENEQLMKHSMKTVPEKYQVTLWIGIALMLTGLTLYVISVWK